MEIQVAIIILLVALIIAALAIYLIATILELFKINAGLDVVLVKVGEIVAKSAPVNGVLDAINGTLVTTRDALEGLFIKKAGGDAGGLVESVFPGEGQKFLRRVGRSGKVVNVGTVYTRGVGILASLGRGAPIGAGHTKGPAVRDPQYSTTAASMLYPRPGGAKARPKSPVVGAGAPQQYEAALTPGTRTRDAQGRAVDQQQQAQAAPPAAAPQAQSAPPPTRMTSAKGSRPWEKQAAAASQAAGQQQAAPAAPPAQPAPAPAGSGGSSSSTSEAASVGGRLSAKGSRPWER